MPYEITSLPADTADLFRPFHRAPDAAIRRRLIVDSSLPEGCEVSLKVSKSETHDQDRLNLPQSIALSLDRVWGRAISIREETDTANTDTRASANVLLRIPFWDAKAYAYRPVFVRSTAFFSNFAPRCPDNMKWNLVRGDLISGILQKPLIPPLCNAPERVYIRIILEEINLFYPDAK